MSPVAIALFVVGYPVAIAVIIRWMPVMRERRTTWFAVHTLAMIAIVAGQALNGRTIGIVINGTWLVSSVLWY